MENLTPEKLRALRDKGIAERDAEARKRQKEKEAVDESNRQYYKKRIGGMLEQFEKELKETAQKGSQEFVYEYATNYLSNHPFRQALEEYCNKNRLKHEFGHSSGTSNMGDSYAPCNVDWESYWIKVRLY